MKKEPEHCRKLFLSLVFDAGGYIDYDALDDAFDNICLPSLTFAGWGSFDGYRHNNCVAWAHHCAECGELENTGEGYRLTSEGSKLMSKKS